MHHLIQSLEGRQLMSAAPIVPSTPKLISEPVSEYAQISQKVRIGYLPTLKIGHVSQLHSTIDWGDGSSSQATFERDKHGGIDVMGTHAYAKPGTFSIGATVTESPYTKPGTVTPLFVINLGTVDTKATVATTPATLTETATTPFTATLGKFNYFTLDVILSAKINWGDGHITTGTLTGGDLANGNWKVTGTHTYGHTGLYTVHADVYSKVAGSSLPPTLFKGFVTLIRVMGHA